MSPSASAPLEPSVEVLDVIGVGFGPSNLALAIALAEHNLGGRKLTARFIERQERFGWHRGMLIEDATMQVSFLKDLVTPRNPESPFTFLSYLHSRDRLSDFINYGSVYPSRLEFHDYLEWAAAKFADQVDYGSEVVAIRPVRRADGLVEHVEIQARDALGDVTTHRARNVVLATGLTPHLPAGVTPGERIWHSHDLLRLAPKLIGTGPERAVVVGAGQSAAEVLGYLHTALPDTEVCAVFARYGYSPADDSSFANRIFDPVAVDEFYTAPDAVKARLLDYHANTNYSVVDPELIDALYRRHYHERVAGRERLRFLNMTRVTEVAQVGDRVELAVESLVDGSVEVINTDLVVYATGYRSSDPDALLGDFGVSWDRDAAGRLRIRRDYRVATAPEVLAGVYLQGPTEHTHGISSSLLSNVAVRTGEIVASISAAAVDQDRQPVGRPTAPAAR
ncbi:lysine N(6)-hydroxylase/L-ornithine N(5)-oxygenase family protein [Pseudonocardia acaciae]|uniref:lysine N(6)-hydroxylase/L-ornithine N(5)-oxygenase family protein n=1 Tax=Pseudonocardia acaciae TaxID=551276 RepID=UPI0012ECF31F|nr:lysine N(6)-hydroxylase/L-ornithine N(5)-oxygenase family protein [Pseudonocardia acaciae]